jgi:hypothetical protein
MVLIPTEGLPLVKVLLEDEKWQYCQTNRYAPSNFWKGRFCFDNNGSSLWIQAEVKSLFCPEMTDVAA